jgi:hypothetical protein
VREKIGGSLGFPDDTFNVGVRDRGVMAAPEIAPIPGLLHVMTVPVTRTAQELPSSFRSKTHICGTPPEPGN